MTARPIVLAMTGASGAAYGQRLIQVLLGVGAEVHLVISPAAALVIETELGIPIDLARFDPRCLVDAWMERLRIWDHRDLAAGIASGSFRTQGMVICPCSQGTLGAIAAGMSTNLIHRAAEVHLKERRKLILVPRETPLSLISIENMARISRAGGILLPASPGFYHQPKSIDELIDFVVARICDQLDLAIEGFPRWGDIPPSGPSGEVLL